MQVDSKVRVVVAGYGNWGRNLVRNFSDLGVLAAVCETSSEQRDAFRKAYEGIPVFDDFEAILSDPAISAVALATPAATHADLVRAALKAGKDVFVEKPLSLSVADGQSLVELARKLERVLMVGHLLRYHPAIIRLKDMIDRGDLGKIQYIYSTRLNLGRVRREENILWSFAPHDVSVVLGLLGEMPDSVQAHAGNYLQQNVADVTVSLLSFPSGAKAHFFVSWLHPFKEQKLVVVGDRCMAVFNDQEPVDKLALYHHGVEWRSQTPVLHKAEAETVPLPATEPLREECLHFIECVRTRARPLTDGDEGLQVLRVLDECQKAIENPKPVLPEEKPKPNYSAHESAVIDAGVEIGKGTAIWHFSHILKGSSIGRNCRIGQNVVVGPHVAVGDGCKIQNNVSVYEGVTLEDGVFCGPSMVFTNVINPRSEIPRMGELKKTLIRNGATLGANCTIVCGTTVGRYAFVAAGSVVTRNVPDFTLVMGSPARVKGYVCVCAERINFVENRSVCKACGRKFILSDGVVSEQIEVEE